MRYKITISKTANGQIEHLKSTQQTATNQELESKIKTLEDENSRLAVGRCINCECSAGHFCKRCAIQFRKKQQELEGEAGNLRSELHRYKHLCSEHENAKIGYSELVKTLESKLATCVEALKTVKPWCQSSHGHVTCDWVKVAQAIESVEGK